jgi:A/G-specific adenine glycosylase
MEAIVDTLIRWFLENRRDLPWRTLKKRRDSYQTWISEIMLQQTQVETVKTFYERWMSRFPTVYELACAEEEEVLQYWAGLGYYSRARNILKSSRIIVEQYSGKLPSTRKELLSLPGIGEYTAGAILSLAQNKSEPILDGNLIRVFSRYYGIHFLPLSKEGKRTYWNYAAKWVEAGEPRHVNEGLMELGALVCVPATKPKCETCPISLNCYAHRNQEQTLFPPAKPKKEQKILRHYSFVVSYGNFILLYKRQEQELLKGHYVFPEIPISSAKVDTKIHTKKITKEVLNPLLCLFPEGYVSHSIRCEELGQVRHAITHHKIQLHVWKVQLSPRGSTEMAPPNIDGHIWIPYKEVPSMLVSSLSQKVWKLHSKS